MTEKYPLSRKRPSATMVLTQPPQKSAALFLRSGPAALIGLGVFLIAIGRGIIGLPLVFIGLNWLRRSRPIRPMPNPGGQKSTVRTAHLEIGLDQDIGEMDGTVLTGSLRGSRLSSLSEHDIIGLYREFQAGPDSVALLESYLDRHHQDWREQSGNDSHDSQAGTAGNQPMSREEAREILGVSADASREEILAAWRRLVKKVHPDSGGSALLTEKINAAKDVLLQ